MNKQNIIELAKFNNVDDLNKINTHALQKITGRPKEI